MKDEILKILSQLKDKKISDEQAIKLIDLLYDKESHDGSTYNMDESLKNTIEYFKNNCSDMSGELYKELEDINKKMLGNISFDNDKFSAYLKNIEGRLKNISESLSDEISKDKSSSYSRKFSGIENLKSDAINEMQTDTLKKTFEKLKYDIDRISIDDSIIKDKLPDFFNKIEKDSQKYNNYVKIIKKDACADCMLDIILETACGNIVLDNQEGNSINVGIYTNSQSKYTEKLIDYREDKGQFKIKARHRPGLSISLYAYLPGKNFKDVFLSAASGRIGADKLSASSITGKVSDGKINFSCVSSRDVKIALSDSTADLYDIMSERIYIKGSNSEIILERISCPHIYINTANEKITVSDIYNISENNELRLYNQNAGIDLEIDVADDTGIFVDAYSLNGKVIIDRNIKGLSFEVNESDHVICKSSNCERFSKNIKISAQTTNSFINIFERP